MHLLIGRAPLRSLPPSDSDNEESNHVTRQQKLTAATPAPSVEFQPWGAPVMDHDK